MKKEKFDVNNQEHRNIAKKYLSNAVVQKKPTWNIASLGYSSCPFDVSYPTDATTVLFVQEEDTDDVFFFEDSLDNFKYSMTKYFKSLGETDVWVGREDHAVLENNLAYFGISEYCGVLSFWVLPKESFPNLSVNWTKQIANKFKKAVKESFGEVYVRVGRFSDATLVLLKE